MGSDRGIRIDRGSIIMEEIRVERKKKEAEERKGGRFVKRYGKEIRGVTGNMRKEKKEGGRRRKRRNRKKKE